MYKGEKISDNEKDYNAVQSDSINHQNSEGSPLEYKMQNNWITVIKSFINNGANVTPKNPDGKTALDLARENLLDSADCDENEVKSREAIVKLLSDAACLQAAKTGALERAASPNKEHLIQNMNAAVGGEQAPTSISSSFETSVTENSLSQSPLANTH